MKNIHSNKDLLLTKLSSYVKRKSVRNILLHSVKILLLVFIILFFFTLLETFFYFGSSVKTQVLLSILFIAIVLFFYLTSSHFKKYLSSGSINEISSAAREIGIHFDKIKDNLLNSIQLIKKNSSSGSKELTEAAFENIYQKVKSISFNKLIKFSNIKKYSYILLGSVILFISLIYTFDNLNRGAIRVINFSKDYSKPNDFSLQVLTKDLRIKKGDDLIVEVSSTGEAPEEIFFLFKSESDAEHKKYSVRRNPENNYAYNLTNVQSSFSYYVTKNNITSKIYSIDVESPPIISTINFEIVPPKYSRLPSTFQENNGNISTLKGSKINFELISTKKLIKAEKVSSNKIDSLAIFDNTVTGSFIAKKNDKYYFEITDTNNYKNLNPIEYSINIIEDKFPEIEIIKPNQFSLVPSSDIVNINFLIKDDFGFSKLLLKYSKAISTENLESVNYTSTEITISKRELEQSLYYNWDIARLGLRENEEASYYFEIYDNDYVSGPKFTRTYLYKLRVPTLDELFAEAENTQNSAMDDLTEALIEAEELKNELEMISNELKQNEQNIDWNEKERIEESAKKFEKLSDKVEEVQKKLDEMRQNMAENNLLSDETLEKYNELQKLMEDLNSEDLRKAMEEMQNSLEEMMRDKVQQSLDNLAMNEEMFQKSIERTLNLLKKIQIEQKMDEVIKRTEKINEDLEKLSEETKENLNNTDNNKDQELLDNQKNVSEQMKSLNDELEKLKDIMSEVNDTPLQKMEELTSEFEKQNNDDLSKKAEQNLQQQNKFDALKNQQELSENMSSMQNQLQQMQDQMQQQSQQMVMQKMLKAIDNIISLSKEQELLKNSSADHNNVPDKLKDEIQSQMDLKQNLDNILKQLGDLSQKTFAITPEMGEALGKARNNMNQALSGMQNKNSQQSKAGQTEAMNNMNDAAAFLQNSFQNMMQQGGQGGGGMMSMMQQLQKMAQQQMGLNRMTQMMNKGQLSMQQQAQLQRLAQEQLAIQKSLQELNKEAMEAGESKKISSNLEKIVNDMNEVISGYNTKKVDDELIKAQEKILSKLLDAQKSINERDFEKNRESISGRDFIIDSPNQLNLNDDIAGNALREELIQSIKEGYSKDYENLIRKYFEYLNSKSKLN